MQEKYSVRTSPNKIPNSKWVDCEVCQGTGMHPKKEFVLCPQCCGQCGVWVVVEKGLNKKN